MCKDRARRRHVEKQVFADRDEEIFRASKHRYRRHDNQPQQEELIRSRADRLLLSSNSSLSEGAGHEASLNVISGSSVGSGEYMVSLSVGTPPQELFLIADTGSDLTWVKCRSSSSFPFPLGLSLPSAASASIGPGSHASMNQSFDATVSSSFCPLSCQSSECSAWSPPRFCRHAAQRCTFSFSYTDRSTSAGHLVFESLIMGNNRQAQNVVIGCGRRYEGPNFDKAGGVLALGQGPLSLPTQFAARFGYSDKFSYCLTDFLGADSVVGSLAFGGSSLHSADVQYTPLLSNPSGRTFYYVGVKAVKVGDVELDIPAELWAIDSNGAGGTIVDSGTTLAQFVQPAYNMIRDAFQAAIRDMTPLDGQEVPGLDLCYSTSSTASSFQGSTKAAGFPNFAIVFDGGLVLQPPVQNYFTEAAPGISCLAMQGVPQGSFSVIGNLLQQNYLVEFDREKQRLGMSRADCATLHS
ncbi:hypothetical protein KP509_17G018300 [Ceratopteris richardii]|nr:hypothetical protein KP509_17G018300 [Ceratopteris richardii]